MQIGKGISNSICRAYKLDNDFGGDFSLGYERFEVCSQGLWIIILIIVTRAGMTISHIGVDRVDGLALK